MITNIRLSIQAEHCGNDANGGMRNTDTWEQRDEPHCCNSMQISPVYNPVTVIHSAKPSDDSGQARSYDYDVTDFAEVTTLQNVGEIYTAVIAEPILTSAPCVKTQVTHQQRNRPERYVPHSDTPQCSVINNAHEVRTNSEVLSMNSEIQRGRHSTMRQLETHRSCDLNNVFPNRRTKVTLASVELKNALCTEPRVVENPENFNCTTYGRVGHRLRQRIVKAIS